MISICSVKLELEIAIHHFGHHVQMNQQAKEGSVLCQRSVSAQLSRGNIVAALLWEQGEVFLESGRSSGTLHRSAMPSGKS